MDQNGMAMTSDVIAACNWILQNKAAYNIRIANFSLHSSAKNYFHNDPLEKAVEKLWFNGIFVVAAAGNYGTGNGPSGVWCAPGNDPLVLTVGAADLCGTVGSATTRPRRSPRTATRRTGSRCRRSAPPAAT
jgi:serine protease AprX